MKKMDLVSGYKVISSLLVFDSLIDAIELLLVYLVLCIDECV